MSAIDRLQRLRVSDVMTRSVVRVAASATMNDAAHVLADHHLSCVPVVNDRGECVGMLSATDFVKRLPDPTVRQSLDQLPIAKCMSLSVQSVEPDAPLLLAAQILTVAHIHHLPVLDVRKQPIGVLSTMDVVAALLTAVEEAQSQGT